MSTLTLTEDIFSKVLSPHLVNRRFPHCVLWCLSWNTKGLFQILFVRFFPPKGYLAPWQKFCHWKNFTSKDQKSLNWTKKTKIVLEKSCFWRDKWRIKWWENGGIGGYPFSSFGKGPVTKSDDFLEIFLRGGPPPKWKKSPK